jgi:hypothetical protein
MKKYYIYKIDENGTPHKKYAIMALNIENVWQSEKVWFTNGIFLITSANGLEGKIFIK